ncbi:hypothetical protein [Halorubellus sp. PRR65]|nr:hypothetical protein [Halorubellus sp. PRR65]
MTGNTTRRDAAIERARGSKPLKGEETVAEIGKEYIHGSTVRWCR